MTERVVIIILRETALQSLVADAGTVGSFLSLIGIGLWLDSAALQWVGAILGFVFIIIRARGRNKRRTIAEARSYLDELEAGK